MDDVEEELFGVYGLSSLFEFAVPERSLEAGFNHARCGAEELLLRDLLCVGTSRLSDLPRLRGDEVLSIDSPSRPPSPSRGVLPTWV